MKENAPSLIDRTILLPIAMLFTAVSLVSLSSLFSDYIKDQHFNMVMIGYNLTLLVLLSLLWVKWTTHSRKIFYYISVIACVVVLSGWVYNNLQADSNPASPIRWLFSLIHPAFLLLVFLLIFYRKQLISNIKSGVDILVFLGIYFIFRSLFSIVYNAVINGFFDYYSIPALVVGIAILGRERFFGLFGSFVLIVLPYLINNQLLHRSADQSLLSIILMIIQISLFSVCVFVILLMLNKTCFKYNFFASDKTGYSYGFSKTCSNCGRQVPSSSAAGQRCPYCGAYWSTEHRKYQ
jgi:hypothetical protein